MQVFRRFQVPAAARGAVYAVGNFDGLHRGHRAVIGEAGARRFDDDELVAADAGPPVGDPLRQRRVEGERPGTRVDHDEVVAEPVHLAE